MRKILVREIRRALAKPITGIPTVSDKPKIERNFLARAVQFKCGQYLLEHKEWAERTPTSEIAEKLQQQFGGTITHRNVDGLLEMVDIQQIAPTPPMSQEQKDICMLARVIVDLAEQFGTRQSLPGEVWQRIMELAK